jgi:hypothetical protein
VEVSIGLHLGNARETYVLTATDPPTNKVATDANGSWKTVAPISNALPARIARFP